MALQQKQRSLHSSVLGGSVIWQNEWLKDCVHLDVKVKRNMQITSKGYYLSFATVTLFETILIQGNEMIVFEKAEV